MSILEPETRPAADASLTDKEFSAHVVARGLDTVQKVQAYVVVTKEKIQADSTSVPKEEHMTVVGIEAYMYKNQRDLGRRIQFAWDAVAAPRLVEQGGLSAWEFIVRARTGVACVCAGRWPVLTEDLLAKQVAALPPSSPANEAPTSSAVKAAIIYALKEGSGKKHNVFFYGPKDAGKSHLLKPLIQIYREFAFTRPVGVRSSFPLQDIFGKKVVVLQDLRTSTYQMTFDALLVWFEGESFRVPMPQNHHQGDKLYDEQAPIFASAGAKLRISKREAYELGVDEDEQNEMMDARWKCFHHSVSLDRREECSACSRCFANWLCT